MGFSPCKSPMTTCRIVPVAAAFALLVATALPAIGPPAGWRDRALTFADYEHMFGALHATATGYAGSFVSFQFNETTLGISDYIVMTPSRTTSVFQTIVPQVVALGVSSVNGSTFNFTGSAMDISVHNNPTSTLMITSKAAIFNETFTLSSGIDAARNGQSLNLSSPDLTGHLFVTGGATLGLVGTVATATLPAGTSVIFRAEATAGEGVAGASGQQQLGDASVQGLLALESFAISLEGFIEMSDVEYGGCIDLGANVTANGLEINLVSTAPSARFAALHLHESVIHTDNETSIIVTLDDQRVSELSTLDEVLTHSDGGSVFAYIRGVKGLLLLIKLPQQGNHVLKIESSVSTEQQGFNLIQLAAIVAVILVLLGVAAAVMLRRRPPR